MKQSKIKQSKNRNLSQSIKHKKKVFFLDALAFMEIRNAKNNKGGKNFHLERKAPKKMPKAKHKLKQCQSISKVWLFLFLVEDIRDLTEKNVKSEKIRE